MQAPVAASRQAGPALDVFYACPLVYNDNDRGLRALPQLRLSTEKEWFLRTLRQSGRQARL
jgi:hypothetical protein